MDYVEVIIGAQPALSWNAMRNMTKVELKLIPDPDKYILREVEFLIFLNDIIRQTISI